MFLIVLHIFIRNPVNVIIAGYANVKILFKFISIQNAPIQIPYSMYNGYLCFRLVYHLPYNEIIV